MGLKEGRLNGSFSFFPGKYPLRLHACALSCFSRVQLSVTLWTVARQAPLSMGFPRQTYWSGLPLPAPGDLPDPGIESASPVLAGRFFTAEPPRNPLFSYRIYCLGESESRSVVSNSS